MFDNIEILNLKTAWREAAQLLKKIGIETPLLDARLLLQNTLNIKYEELIVSADRVLNGEEKQHLINFLKRRAKREPVSKIIGQKEFWGLSFITAKDNLDPRPDSETLIEAVIQNYTDNQRNLNILDLGTGSGCLLLTLLFLYPNAKGIGVDKSLEALKIAGENTKKHNLQDRAEFFVSDWFSNIEGKFDIIICNPPYIKSEAINYLEPEVRFFDPKIALDGGADGLGCYRELLAEIENYLETHGKIFFEIGKWQEAPIVEMIEENGFEVLDIKQDLQAIPRVISFTKPYLKLVK